jgi:crossover junction endodeoxyribonuclease RusA
VLCSSVGRLGGILEIEFPIEFLVYGTAVSHQRDNPRAKKEWKQQVRDASSTVLPYPHFASDDRIAVTLYYFPAEPMPGDIDNIVKLILDALGHHVYRDDHQVERLLVQKFEPGLSPPFSAPSETMLDALTGERPVLYVRMSNDPFEDVR